MAVLADRVAVAALYPRQVPGVVLLDASSEPEVAVYDRLNAGPWIDGTVQPAPNQKINIGATVRQLERAPSLSQMPLTWSQAASCRTAG